jgi:predicted flavoprotein YhiN
MYRDEFVTCGGVALKEVGPISFYVVFCADLNVCVFHP